MLVEDLTAKYSRGNKHYEKASSNYILTNSNKKGTRKKNSISSNCNESVPMKCKSTDAILQKGCTNTLAKIKENLEENPWLVIQAFMSLDSDKVKSQEKIKKKIFQETSRSELLRQVNEKKRRQILEAEEKDKFTRDSKLEIEKEMERIRNKLKCSSENAIKCRIENEKLSLQQKQRRQAELDSLVAERRIADQKREKFLQDEKDNMIKQKEMKKEQMRLIMDEKVRKEKCQMEQKEKENEEYFLMLKLEADKDRREKERREAEIENRVMRYQTLGKIWEERGAGKLERLAELEFEKRLLQEASEKEKKDALREQNEKIARVQGRLRCHEENTKLIEAKAADQKLQRSVEHHYSIQQKQVYDKFAEEERMKREAIQSKKREYGAILKEQAQQHSIRKKMEDLYMTKQERAINSSLIHSIVTDPIVAEKLYEKLHGSHQKSKSTSFEVNPPWV